jgi:hypothetical protein
MYFRDHVAVLNVTEGALVEANCTTTYAAHKN